MCTAKMFKHEKSAISRNSHSRKHRFRNLIYSSVLRMNIKQLGYFVQIVVFFILADDGTSRVYPIEHIP